MNAIFWKAATTEWLLRQAVTYNGGMMQRACIEVHQLIFKHFDEIEDLAQGMASAQAPEPMSELHPEVKGLIARVAALCAELLQSLAEYDSANPYHEHRDLITRARAVLAMLDRAAFTPIPVSERLPGAEDCDAKGRCWWGDAGDDEFVPSWRLCEQPDIPCFDHWLPHWAIRLPQPLASAPETGSESSLSEFGPGEMPLG